MKMLVMGVSTIGSALGWSAGRPFGVFSAFILSVVGLGLGIYAGRQLANRWGL